MKVLNGKTAAITGAASGIGRMLAVRLAEEGCRLALADIDETGLRETASLLDGSTPVSLHVTDVARKPEVDRFAAEAADRHGGVDLIINNAGVALGDLLEFACLEDFEWLMGIDFWGWSMGPWPFSPFSGSARRAISSMFPVSTA
jgi:NAD(P)-dependent dehydrogenase (short-subunit alcohol dehydrogenase family)